MKLEKLLRKAADLIDQGGLPVMFAIQVWPGKKEYVPESIWDSFEDHDDINWIAFVLDIYRYDYISWIQSTSFGSCDVEKIDFPGGVIYIGYH
jgi:hypothetical protein